MERGLIFKVGFSIFLFFNLLVEATQLSRKAREAVEPYLMPENHPIKSLLNTFFSSSRVIFNLSTLEKAGFTKTKPRKFTKLIVTKHNAFPGYVFKLYLDAQRYYKDLPEYHYWILRVKGVRKIQKEIIKNHFQDIFKAPQKWIYELPKHPKPPRGYYPKYYLLIEEDMDILDDQSNKNLWASNDVSTEFLDSLYFILKKLGLSDCAKPDNIPFSTDGRIAFIDTQLFGKKKVNYQKLNPYLSKENCLYWKAITNQ